MHVVKNDGNGIIITLSPLIYVPTKVDMGWGMVCGKKRLIIVIPLPHKKETWLWAMKQQDKTFI